MIINSEHKRKYNQLKYLLLRHHQTTQITQKNYRWYLWKQTLFPNLFVQIMAHVMLLALDWLFWLYQPSSTLPSLLWVILSRIFITTAEVWIPPKVFRSIFRRVWPDIDIICPLFLFIRGNLNVCRNWGYHNAPWSIKTPHAISKCMSHWFKGKHMKQFCQGSPSIIIYDPTDYQDPSVCSIIFKNWWGRYLMLCYPFAI